MLQLMVLDSKEERAWSWDRRYQVEEEYVYIDLLEPAQNDAILHECSSQ